MSDIYGIAKSGLQAYREGLATTGQNIANVGNENYARREVNLAEVKSASADVLSISPSSSYGVKVDQDLHAEILKRNEKFKGAAYAGFVNPELEPVYNENGELIDIEVKYVNSFEYQMLKYSEQFGFLD